ncbi:MAG: hypothetical protein HYR88_09210 [Verrucomicrobia bacterium]|nr:hypothetical protein [Verrucomicrobiota bacterium]MBI3871072.1 hypothetical protein [Verrucomicrobiota bacterium]
MQIIPFVASTAAEAFARIQSQMGPEAVVLNVRQIPVSGLARLWRKPNIEVLACPPGALRMDSGPVQPPPAAPKPVETTSTEILATTTPPSPSFRKGSSRWGVAGLLPGAGLNTLSIEALLADLEAEWGAEPPPDLATEITHLRETLRRHWRVQGHPVSGRPQVFIGPQGCGKTTALCKWIAQLFLAEGKQPRVVRMDGVTANTSETLDVHAEILGIPVSRIPAGRRDRSSGEWELVDIPGVDWRDPRAIGELRRVLDKISGAEVHLVLNGAYEIPVLLSQIRAFSDLSPHGLIVTHLDEETRWGKLWNLVLGAPLALRFLSVGPAIPGGFLQANPDQLNDRWLRR